MQIKRRKITRKEREKKKKSSIDDSTVRNRYYTHESRWTSRKNEDSARRADTREREGVLGRSTHVCVRLPPI